MRKCEFRHKIVRYGKTVPIVCRYRFDTADPRTNTRACWIARVQITQVDSNKDIRKCSRFSANVSALEWDGLYDAAYHHLTGAA
jgi:hypothetical protein